MKKKIHTLAMLLFSLSICVVAGLVLRSIAIFNILFCFTGNILLIRVTMHELVPLIDIPL